jgi:iron complex outermembrane recepter protein
MHKKFIRCLSLISILWSCLLSVQALGNASEQTSGSEIEGVILDSTGAAVAGAELVLRRISAVQEWRASSDSAGRFVFHTVADGQYTIRVSAKGFAVAEKRVTVAGQNAVVNLTLSPSAVSESVSVRAESYLERESSIGTRIDTPLIELPQAVTVVNRQLLTEQSVVTLEEALKNVAGVKAGGYHRGWDYYRIRGFDASFTTFIDGLRVDSGLGEETFGLERVEVIKGPSSALYGQAVLGGIVNLQSKRPRPDAFADVQLTGGSFNYYEAALDVGSSLNKSRTLYGRLNTLYRPQKSFVDFANSNRWYWAPALTWEATPATTVTFLTRLQLDSIYYGFPLPAKGTVLPNLNGELPIERFLGEPTTASTRSNEMEYTRRQIGYQLTHRFNETFSLHQNARLATQSQRWDNMLYPGYLSDDERVLYRYPYNWSGRYTNFRIDTPLQATFNTGSVRHNAVIGVDYFRYLDIFRGESIDFNDLSAYLPIDLYTPVYGAVQLPPLQPVAVGRTITQSVGWYIQDQVNLYERLSLTLSGRFDSASLRSNDEPANKDTAFSPRLGATYRFIPNASAYFSYSESFLPQTGRIDDGTGSGSFVDPEAGRQWETGVKTFLLGGRATTTLALFRLLRRNVATPNPVNPNFILLTGEQRSQGIELETTLNLIPGWSLTAAYAYIDARVTADNAIPIGTRTQNVPRNSYNIWTRYEFQRGRARGIALGIGGQYYSAQAGDQLDTFQIPRYGLADLLVSYRRGRFRLQLNLNNTLNRRYFTGSYDPLYVLPGAPRNARVTAGWSF